MFGFQRKSKEIYADNAAGTPIRKEAKEAMSPWLDASWNPSAIHPRGVKAREAVEHARKHIATLLYAHPDEITFTSSGTEAIHLALHSLISQTTESIPHIIISSIEHHALLEPLEHLAQKGKIVLEYLPLLSTGVVDTSTLKAMLRPSTVLVAVMFANNETGVIQPIRAITKVVRDYKKDHKVAAPYVLTDACQAFLSLECHVERLGVDYLVLNSAKVGGPEASALLYTRRGAPLTPFLRGGGQEGGRRAGTENVAGIIGFGAALAVAQTERGEYSKYVGGLRDDLEKYIVKEFPDAHVNGTAERLPGHLNVTFGGCDHQYLALALGQQGIMVGTRSACRENDDGDSHVLIEMRRGGDTPKLPAQAIRISLGKENTHSDVESILKALQTYIPLARASKSV